MTSHLPLAVVLPLLGCVMALPASSARKVITEKRYAACRDKSVNPTSKWVKTVKTKANVKSKIPGTSRTQPATLVTARLRVQGFTVPITAHMYYEEGT